MQAICIQMTCNAHRLIISIPNIMFNDDKSVEKYLSQSRSGWPYEITSSSFPESSCMSYSRSHPRNRRPLMRIRRL